MAVMGVSTAVTIIAMPSCAATSGPRIKPASYATTFSGARHAPVFASPRKGTGFGAWGAASLPSVGRTTAISAGAASQIHYKQIEVTTHQGVGLFDITPDIKALLADIKAAEGVVNVMSRHTTTALTINEMEPRLIDDVRQFLPRLVSPTHPYLHNDLHLRDAPDGWPGGADAWRDQEPINAHSHLQAMLLGQSETIPVHQGKLVLGTWQSVIMVELDGTKGRKRTVALQFMGETRD